MLTSLIQGQHQKITLLDSRHKLVTAPALSFEVLHVNNIKIKLILSNPEKCAICSICYCSPITFLRVYYFPIYLLDIDVLLVLFFMCNYTYRTSSYLELGRELLSIR